MFQVVKWPLELIIYLLDVAKCRFDNVDERMFLKWSKSPEKVFPAYWPPQNTTCVKSIKRFFIVSTHNTTGFSALWQT
jgi:hypothetical protein